MAKPKAKRKPKTKLEPKRDIYGHPIHPSFEQRPLKRTSCPRCKETVLFARYIGFDVWLAPVLLSVEQEIAAISAGLNTFEIRANKWRQRTDVHDMRDARAIRRDATNGRPLVMTTHICLGRRNA